MVIKKKYRFGLSALLVLLFIMLLGMFSSCYASKLTPINNMTPEIFKEMVDYIYNSNSFYYVSTPSVLTNYNNFYSTVTDQQIENFCTMWNNTDFSNYADYLEQCVFVVSYSNTNPQILVFFNNNTIGNKPLHFKVWCSDYSYIYYYYFDDNNNLTSSSRFAITFYNSGSINFGGPYTTGTGGTYVNMLYGYVQNFNKIDNSNFSAPFMYCYNLPQSIFTKFYEDNNYSWRWLNGSSVLEAIPELEPEPEFPSGDNGLGNITTPSGDNGGNINLEPIQQGLTDIKNQISGDTQKIVNTLTQVPELSGETISSEQITDNIDFGLINNNSTLNGYTNFWLTLTNSLRGALTGNVRSIDINFRGESYTISLDDFSIQLPQQLKFILGMVSTIYFVILIVKWWKIIIDKITGGDIDEVLAMNEEERHY